MQKSKEMNNDAKVESFYRYKINTKMDVINAFEEIRATKGKKEGEEPVKIIKTRFLAANVLLHSKYNNKQVIAYNFTKTVLKKLGYDEQAVNDLSGGVDNIKESTSSPTNINNGSKRSSLKRSSLRRSSLMRSSRESVNTSNFASNRYSFEKWKAKHPKMHFIVDAKYSKLIEELKKRDWVECQKPDDVYFDFKFSQKAKEINYELTDPNQLVNHNPAFEKITLTIYLYSLLKILINSDINADLFFPRCYDLKCYRDHKNFISDYKLCQCVMFLKWFITLERLNDVILFKAVISLYGITNYLELQYESKHEGEIISNRDIDLLLQPKNKSLWVLSKEDEEQITRYLKKIGLNEKLYKTSGEYVYALKKKTTELLEKYKKANPQYDLLQDKNAWILKSYNDNSSFTTRIFNNYKDIIAVLIDIKDEVIAMKYIERPLLVLNKKFMIKAWMVINAEKPLTAWFYNDYYLQFSTKNYDINSFNDPFMHLTTSSVDKNPFFMKEDAFKYGFVWTKGQYRNYQQDVLKLSPEAIKDQEIQLKKIGTNVVKSNIDKAKKMRNSFVLLGLDVIVDNNYRLWLVKVNPCSAISNSNVS